MSTEAPTRPAPSPLTGAPVRWVERVGRTTRSILEELGRHGRIFGRGVGALLRPPVRVRLWFKQMEFVGFQSLSIVMITGAFTGAVFALQSNVAFSLFGAQGLVGSTVGLALSRELGPVLTALMVTGRAGSAMAAEIGTMRVTEQIDALEAMGVEPVGYLVTPRLLASVLMVPALAMVFNLVGILGAWFVGVSVLGISEGPFVARIDWYVDPDDITGGLIKASVFGLIMAIVGCTRGFYTEGGAEGVGRSTTRAVVDASVAILIADYFLTNAML